MKDTKFSSSDATPGEIRAAERRAAGASKPRLGFLAPTQLGNRLKAIYGCDQAPMSATMSNLLSRIETCLKDHK